MHVVVVCCFCMCACVHACLCSVFGWIDAYAPGFKDLVMGYEVLTPQDLESIFGLTGGNIFHGAMSIDQLYLSRPTPRNVGYSSQGVEGLFLCGSGAHPGNWFFMTVCLSSFIAKCKVSVLPLQGVFQDQASLCF